MAKHISKISLGLISSGLFGCSHFHKDIDRLEPPKSRTHVVSITGPEVSEGERIDVIRQTCKSKRVMTRHADQDVKVCSETKIGLATVTKVRDQKTSEVVLDEHVPWEESLIFEKQLSEKEKSN